MVTKRRFHELDSLRGIGAFTVMISHLLIIFPVVWNTTNPADASAFLSIFLFSPLRIVSAGHEAVVFFFILSGYVLSLPFLNGSITLANYPSYAIKRIIRIYPPYLFASILAFAACMQWSDRRPLGVSDWFNQSWQDPVTFNAIGNHLLMIGSFDNCDFNPVLWSLVHEMRISLIFPLIVASIMRNTKWTLVAAFVFTAIDWASVSLRFRGFIHFDHDYFTTLRYTSFFIVGSILAKNSNSIFERVSAFSRTRKASLVCFAAMAYTNPYWLPYWFFSTGSICQRILCKSWIQEWITCMGVVTFIVLAVCSLRFSKFLNTPLLLFLGTISYSLYLLHAVILKSVISVFGGHAPLFVLLIACAVGSIAAAWAGWLLIESPSIKFGKTIPSILFRTNRKDI